MMRMGVALIWGVKASVARAVWMDECLGRDYSICFSRQREYIDNVRKCAGGLPAQTATSELETFMLPGYLDLYASVLLTTTRCLCGCDEYGMVVATSIGATRAKGFDSGCGVSESGEKGMLPLRGRIRRFY